MGNVDLVTSELRASVRKTESPKATRAWERQQGKVHAGLPLRTFNLTIFFVILFR